MSSYAAATRHSTGLFLVRESGRRPRAMRRGHLRQAVLRAVEAVLRSHRPCLNQVLRQYWHPHYRPGVSNSPPQETFPAPEDIPSGRDDDVVARQLREAAMSEPDLQLREALWQEYRNYTGLGEEQ